MDNSIDFIIVAPNYDPKSGGSIALHKLADNLVKLGESVYIMAQDKHPDWGGLLWNNGLNLKPKTTIVIYPEIIVGNPCQSTHVVRWLLNTPGVCGGDGVYDKNDLIFKFTNYFTCDLKYNIKGLLTAYDLQLDRWFGDFYRYDSSDICHSGECYIIRKGVNKPLNQHSPHAVNISQYKDNQFLFNMFNICERFISYDHACFISVQAALCGIESIVIPDGKFDSHGWRRRFPYFKYGIAYGFDQKELEYAKNTLHLVRDNLKKLEKLSIQQTKEFIEICKEKIK